MKKDGFLIRIHNFKRLCYWRKLWAYVRSIPHCLGE